MAQITLNEGDSSDIINSINSNFSELYTAALLGTPTYTITLGNWGTIRTQINSMYQELMLATVPTTIIATAAIAGVTAPVTGATPTATITATTEYTATISWSPSVGTFGGGTVYTATITLTPKTGYTLTGVTANFFTVAGATATNPINSGIVTAVFPATLGGSYGAEYQAVYNAMTNKPSSGVADAQNTMTQSLVTGGVWAKLDLFYCFAQESNAASEALINWKSPGTYNADNVSSTTWNTLEGFTGDGVADYISTNWNASINGVNFTQNSASLGVYVRNEINANQAAAGTVATNYTVITPRYVGSFYGGINSAGLGSGFTVDSSLGLSTISRPNSTTLSFFRNSTYLGDVSDNSTAIPNGELYILDRSGDPRTSTYQCSFAFAGGNLSDSQVTTVTNAFEVYMDSNSKGVIPIQENLGLNGVVTWIDPTHISVTYDWTNANQLNDFTLTTSTIATRNAGNYIELTAGSLEMNQLIWKQKIAVSRITLVHNSLSSARCNIYTNLDVNFNGSTYSPNPCLGAACGWKWEVNGGEYDGMPPIPTADTWRTYVFETSTTMMRCKSSVDNAWYELPGSYAPNVNGYLAIGNYRGVAANSNVGVLTIEGEIAPYYTDDFQSYNTNWPGTGIPLGGQGNWITCLAGIEIWVIDGTNKVYFKNGLGLGACLYNENFSNNQYSQAQAVLPGYMQGLCVRLSGSGATTNGYIWLVNNAESWLWRLDNGAYTQIAAGSATISANDTLRLEINGSILSMYINGNLDTTLTGGTGHATDNIYASGKPGIGGYNNSSFLGDNWEGGDL